VTSPNGKNLRSYIGLFEMIVGVLTTYHTLEIEVCVFLFNRKTLQVFVTYLRGVPPVPASIPELKVRIRTTIETITADMLQTVWNELDYYVNVCRITKG